MKRQIDVTAAIIDKDEKVFAARRKAGTHLAGYWEFPGGKLEDGETPEQCLERELQELVAILECTDLEFLPDTKKKKVEELGGRPRLQERVTAIKQILDTR